MQDSPDSRNTSQGEMLREESRKGNACMHMLYNNNLQYLISQRKDVNFLSSFNNSYSIWVVLVAIKLTQKSSSSDSAYSWYPQTRDQGSHSYISVVMVLWQKKTMQQYSFTMRWNTPRKNFYYSYFDRIFTVKHYLVMVVNYTLLSSFRLSATMKRNI